MMKKARGIYERDGVLYIRLQDERGHIARESTGQRSLKVAEQILAKRKSEVALRTHFSTRKFESVKFGNCSTIGGNITVNTIPVSSNTCCHGFEYGLPKSMLGTLRRKKCRIFCGSCGTLRI